MTVCVKFQVPLHPPQICGISDKLLGVKAGQLLSGSTCRSIGASSFMGEVIAVYVDIPASIP